MKQNTTAVYGIITILALGMCLILMQCWKRQSHDLLGPNVPHYQLQAEVQDVDTQEPLRGIQIIVDMRAIDIL